MTMHSNMYKTGCDEPFAIALKRLGWADAHLRVALRFRERLCGMLFMSPTAGVAMGFPHCSSVHTWFMRYPLDIAFIDARGHVLQRYDGVGPWQVLGCTGAWGVIERAAAPAKPASSTFSKLALDAQDRSCILIKP